MDHFATNALFGGEVIAHQATRDTMLTMDVDFIRARSKVLYTDPLPIPGGYQLRRPNITHLHGLTLHLGEHIIQIIHTPGHTAGQSAVYIPKEKVLFTGDNVMGEQVTPIHDAVLDKWVESLKFLQGLDVRFVLPGHGKVCNKAYLKT
jgi:cyclase